MALAIIESTPSTLISSLPPFEETGAEKRSR